MTTTIYRVDNWTHKEDTILIDAVLENARKNRPKQEAYLVASKRIDRSASACCNRWHQIKHKVIGNPMLEVEEVVQMIHEPEVETDFIDTIINGTIKKEVKELVGIYLQPDVLNTLRLIGKKGGRGAQSAIVNELLRLAFIEKGLL